MNRKEAEELEAKLMAEVTRRRSLGGYSPDAPTLLLITEALYEIVRHMRERMPAPPKKEEK